MNVIEARLPPGQTHLDITIPRTEISPPAQTAAPVPGKRPAPASPATPPLASRVRDAALLEWAAHGGLWM